MRVMQKHLLFLQALIIRMLFQAIIKGSRKPLTHLFCGRSRKGKYQQVIYIHRMFRVRQKRADVFDQNRCLAASGGSSTYTWISEDEGIASVDSNGKVTAISQGTVNVLVTDGTKKGVCIVRCNVGTQSGSSTSSTTSSSGSGTTSSSGLKTGAAVVVNGGNGVFVRSGPGTSYEALATIPNGAEVKILESAGDGWYKISFAGTGGASTTGYMKGDFLSNG